MMTNNEFCSSLIVPTPLHSIERKLRKNHIYDKNTVRNLINDYMKGNTNLYLSLADFIIEFMNSEVSFKKPDKEMVDRFEAKLETLDNRFEYVNQFMMELSEKERNELTRDSLDETISKLNNYRQKMLSTIKKKENWTKIDALFPSYYDRYLQFLNMIALEGTRNKGFKKEGGNILLFVSFMYQVVIYAYLTEKLNESVMLRRYAELGLLTLDQHKRLSVTRKEITKSPGGVCPPESQDMVASSA